jgi:hypothetical protein
MGGLWDVRLFRCRYARGRAGGAWMIGDELAGLGVEQGGIGGELVGPGG